VVGQAGEAVGELVVGDVPGGAEHAEDGPAVLVAQGAAHGAHPAGLAVAGDEPQLGLVGVSGEDRAQVGLHDLVIDGVHQPPQPAGLGSSSSARQPVSLGNRSVTHTAWRRP
jgi:hypothetical protein